MKYKAFIPGFFEMADKELMYTDLQCRYCGSKHHSDLANFFEPDMYPPYVNKICGFCSPLFGLYGSERIKAWVAILQKGTTSNLYHLVGQLRVRVVIEYEVCERSEYEIKVVYLRELAIEDDQLTYIGLPAYYYGYYTGLVDINGSPIFERDIICTMDANKKENVSCIYESINSQNIRNKFVFWIGERPATSSGNPMLMSGIVAVKTYGSNRTMMDGAYIKTSMSEIENLEDRIIHAIHFERDEKMSFDNYEYRKIFPVSWNFLFRKKEPNSLNFLSVEKMLTDRYGIGFIHVMKSLGFNYT